MSINLPWGYIIVSASGGAIIAWALVWYFARNPEKVEKWSSILFWFFSRIWKRLDYWAITLEIQGKLNSFIRDLGNNTTIDFPHAKIRWAGKNDENIQWEEGEVIIVMRDREHKNKNFVHAAHFFVSEILLRKSKKHLSKAQKTSLDLYATKKVLETQSASAVEQFVDDFLAPLIEKDDQVRGLIVQYLKIDTKGVFFPVLINELIILGGKVFLEKPTAEIIIEVKALIDFLEQFAEREDGSDLGSREFIGNHARCAIRIVASRSARERGDTEPHKNGVVALVKRDFENIYLIGMSDQKNVDFMEAVAGACIEEISHLSLLKRYKFPGLVKPRYWESYKVDTYLIHLHNPKGAKYLYGAV